MDARTVVHLIYFLEWVAKQPDAMVIRGRLLAGKEERLPISEVT